MKREVKIGILQALGITAYCSLIGTVIWNGEAVFGKMNSFIGPITFLVMFSVSAMICGLIVFYQPYKFFFEGKKKEAMNTVLVTAISLVVILTLLFTLLAIF